MSDLTYYIYMAGDKELVWLHGEVKTPPFSADGRLEAGLNLRKLQKGELLSMPISRPMPVIGAHCHELRIVDENQTWRVIYRIDNDAIIILEVFSKKKRETPQKVINVCQARIKDYDS